MDYSLAALKLFCGALKDDVQVPATTPPPSATSSSPASASSSSSSTLFGILFQRAWLQGVLVSTAEQGEGRGFVLDDGTGVVELALTKEILQQQQELAAGMYVMVVGQFLPGAGELPLIKVHKVVDLSSHPDREAIWYLEGIEAYRLFYQSPLED